VIHTQCGVGYSLRLPSGSAAMGGSR
jgi:hypothetical protein